jgi:hypothetical protein
MNQDHRPERKVPQRFDYHLLKRVGAEKLGGGPGIQLAKPEARTIDQSK